MSNLKIYKVNMTKEEVKAAINEVVSHYNKEAENDNISVTAKHMYLLGAEYVSQAMSMLPPKTTPCLRDVGLPPTAYTTNILLNLILLRLWQILMAFLLMRPNH